MFHVRKRYLVNTSVRKGQTRIYYGDIIIKEMHSNADLQTYADG